MYNEILNIGSLTIHGFGLMVAIGLLCAILLASKRAKTRNLSPDIVHSLSLISLVFGFLGAKLLYALVNLDVLISNPIQVLSGSGFVVYGGIIGGVLAAIVFCKLKNVRFLPYFDLVAPSIAVAQGFGRIGCLLAGCCYGRETDSIICIVFHNSTIAPNGVSLVPTQIISSLAAFLLAVILLIYSRNEKTDGKTAALYLVLYSAGRFIIEYFRSDYRGSIGSLSTSQFISIFIFVFGILMTGCLKYWRKKKDAS